MSRHEDYLRDLVVRAKRGDERAWKKLLTELEPDLRKLAAKFYINGSDREDVIQEGRIGIHKAVQDFDPQGGMAFRNFAVNLCVKRHLITQMAAANRKKFSHHNKSISLEFPICTEGDDSEQMLMDFIQDERPPMINDILVREEFEELAKELRRILTQLELAVFEEYTHEESYNDIADSLCLKPKAIDNALMRIRRKAQQIMQEYWLRKGEVVEEEEEEPWLDLDDD